MPARYSRANAYRGREGEELLYQLPKPRADGQSVLELTPVELLERLAALDCMDAGVRATQEQLPTSRHHAVIVTGTTEFSLPTPACARSSPLTRDDPCPAR